MPEIDPSSIKKILLIRPDAIGDMVLATPAISALKNKFPAARITVLARDYNRAALENNPDVDEVIEDEFYFYLSHRRRIPLRLYWRWIGLLRHQQFDVCINFFGEFPYALIAFLAGIPHRIGDRGRIVFSWLYNHPVWQRFNNPLIHEVEHHFELLSPLGINFDPACRLKIIPSSGSTEKAIHLIRENRLESSKLIAVNIGAGKGNKPWSLENFQALIDHLTRKYQTKVFLLGGPQESGLAKRFSQQTQKQVIDLVGLPLGDFIGLVSRMDLYIANDTGPSHLAAALRIPSLIFYNSKYQKPGRWAPWGTNYRILKNVSNCPFPCIPPACDKSICSNEITVAQAAEAADELLAGKKTLNAEEERLYRIRLTLNILLIGESSQKEKLFRILKDADFRVWQFSGQELRALSIKEIREFMVRYDINLIHSFGNIPFKFKVAVLLAKIKTAFPALQIKNRAANIITIKDLVDLYINGFRGLRF
jgi:ADP-heptose:LPS heptosyltransferase